MGEHWAALREALGPRAKADEPLARHTTFRIGGPADLWIQAETLEELIAWVKLARQYDVPVLVLGNGSNVLVMDGGFRGLVIGNNCDDFQLEIAEGRAVLDAASGASLPGLANRMARQGWSGLEWAIRVPGTIGGAVIGNAGAHGASIADSLVEIAVLDQTGMVRQMPKADLQLGYRTSRLKHSRDLVVLSADFELTRQDPEACIRRMNEYTEHRRRTQPTDPSVGSMFKNPPGDFAGRLIERAGLKGERVGPVQVSPVHANFFVNQGGASAAQVLQLVERVRQEVRRKLNAELELEIEIVGEG